MTIIFYDIPSNLPGNVWSPNTFKVRYCLNYKQIPYKTEWVEFPDIEPLCVKLNIPPTGTKADGSPYYTLPALHDPSTGVYLSDSLLIAEYLEKTYPGTPSLFPNNSIVLQNGFVSTFSSHLGALWNFILPAVGPILNPPSERYFRSTREKSFGKKLEDIVPVGQERVVEWAKYKEGLGKVNAWYEKNEGKGPFVLGNTPSFADFEVAGYTVWLRIIWGENSQEWKDISSWHNGRWGKLVNALKEYERVL